MTSTDSQLALSQAKIAFGKGQWSVALEILDQLARAPLDPLARVHVFRRRALALHNLGREDESIARFREALFILISTNLLAAETITRPMEDIAMSVSMGARDTLVLKHFLSLRYRELFKVPRELRISAFVNIHAWCRKEGIEVESFDLARTITVGGDGLNAKSWHYEVENAWAASIPNAEIVSGWDYIIAPTGEVLEGANYMPLDVSFAFMPHLVYSDIGLVAHVWPSDAQYIDEDALFLSTPESHHYGHWVVDFLPRLRAWRRSDVPRQKIVISADLPTKHREMLRCFGVESTDLVECRIGSRYKFRRLTAVRANSDRNPHPASVEFVHRALARAQDVDRPKGRKFYLVRDAGTRMPSNAAALDEVLEAFGIEKVNPTKWTLDEQQRILGQTSLIIAAFGSELLCLYHLPRGADVIELSFDKDNTAVFGPKSAILGLQHHLVDCELLNSGPITRRRMDFDIEIDCVALRQTLRDIAQRP